MKFSIFYFLFIIFYFSAYAESSDLKVIDLDQNQITSQDEKEADSETVIKSVDKVSETLEKNIILDRENPEDEDSDQIILKQKQTEKIDYSNLRSIQFSDSMAIIQKSILDKSHRFQWNLSAGLVTTETYYRTFGVLADVTYHFSEMWGVKIFGYFFESVGRDELNDLENKQRLEVKNLIHLKNYAGLSVYWNPIYGKMTLFNEEIFQYDTFFNIGAGTVNTKTSKNTVGVNFGLGNLYTLSRNSALRFDLNWIFYKAINTIGAEQNANSLILTIGYSGFL